PEPYQSWLWFNPLVHVVGFARAAFYGGYEAEYASLAYVGLWALATLSLGLALLRHDARDLLAR
ncbi:MAG: sugar ABC transporter permease, partial [Pseudomonadota bacterium]